MALARKQRIAAISMLFGTLGWNAPTLAAGPAATQPSPASHPSDNAADTSAPAAPHTGGDDLTGLSLEQLMNVEVEQTNTLTKTDRDLAPSAITTIDRPEIDQSGARSLTALLDIYVPNFESFPN